MVANIPERWQRNVPLSRLTTWRIGGPAAYLSRPCSQEDLAADLALAAGLAMPVFAIGFGSNLLFPDEGYPGLLVRLPSGLPRFADGRPLTPMRGREKTDARTGARERDEMDAGHRDEGPGEMLISCPAGASLSAVARRLAHFGYAGLEWAEGIPGTIGGAIVNNAGAFGGEMADALVSVEALEAGAPPRVWEPPELGLAYRHSRLKGSEPTHAFLLSARFRVRRGRAEELCAQVAAYRSRRRGNAPHEPTCGSVFRNPAGFSAGRLIERAGLSGMRVGDLQISTRHANYMVNRGNATAREALELIALAQSRVRAAFGIDLEPEVQKVGFPRA